MEPFSGTVCFPFKSVTNTVFYPLIVRQIDWGMGFDPVTQLNRAALCVATVKSRRVCVQQAGSPTSVNAPCSFSRTSVSPSSQDICRYDLLHPDSALDNLSSDTGLL